MIDGRPGEMQIKTLIKSIDEVRHFSDRKASPVPVLCVIIIVLPSQSHMTEMYLLYLNLYLNWLVTEVSLIYTDNDFTSNNRA